MNIKAKDSQYVANTYGRFPIEIVKGAGALLWDEAGKEYIDMSSGIAVSTFGSCDLEWVQAVEAQLHKVQHTSNLFYSAPQAELAEMLCTRTGMKKVFFGNSGAEANECAIKVARKYAADKKGAEYHTIITLINSFHGRTLTTLAATGQEVFHQDFLPLTEGFVHAPANDLAAVEELLKKHKVAAIMV
ncbi:MAG: aminotransferase class III-fold pyridoxal phosphate-dependent enzyme, partial [Clostridia bacterium]|nr:aminotransferase class III-fold pyridoxal phosphate-dependent enzyme [Clostridia bacterium]